MSYLGTTKIGKMFLGSTEIGKAYLGNNLVFQKGGGAYSRLPDGYTELSYVATDSDAWIDTGISGSTDLAITIRFSVGTYVQYGALYGNFIDGTHKSNRLIISSTSAFSASGGNNTSAPVSGFSVNRVHTVTISSSTVYVEGTSASIAADSNTANTDKICLGNRSVTTPTTRDIGLRIFAFRVKNSGGTVQNLVPARRDVDSAIGFYDLVSETFFKSETGTAFTAGPDAIFSNGMLLALKWDGADNPSSSKWYDQIGNQYFALTNGTHGTNYFEFINSSPTTDSANAKLLAALPDLGYRWKIEVDCEIKDQTTNPDIFAAIDFGSLINTGTNTTTFAIMCSRSSSNGYWDINSKFDGENSASTYGVSGADYHISSDPLSSNNSWIRRKITAGVRASSINGKDETFISVSGLGDAHTHTPYEPIRFNKWTIDTSYIGRSAHAISSTYKYATSVRIYSIRIFFEPFI